MRGGVSGRWHKLDAPEGMEALNLEPVGYDKDIEAAVLSGKNLAQLHL